MCEWLDVSAGKPLALYSSPPPCLPVPSSSQALKRVCWFVVLAPHGSMQSSLLNSTFADARLLDLPQFK